MLEANIENLCKLTKKAWKIQRYDIKVCEYFTFYLMSINLWPHACNTQKVRSKKHVHYLRKLIMKSLFDEQHYVFQLNLNIKVCIYWPNSVCEGLFCSMFGRDTGVISVFNIFNYLNCLSLAIKTKKMREGEVWKIAVFHSFKMLALLSGIIKSTVCWSASRHFDNCSLTAISKLIGLCFSQGALYAEWEFSCPLVCCWWSGDGQQRSVGRSCQVICSIIVGPFTLL